MGHGDLRFLHARAQRPRSAGRHQEGISRQARADPQHALGRRAWLARAARGRRRLHHQGQRAAGAHHRRAQGRERRQVCFRVARGNPRLGMLQRPAEGAAREAVRSRVSRHVAARHRQADQRDRPRDGPFAFDRKHLSHAHPAQARPRQQRGARALRSPAPARRLETMSEAATVARNAPESEPFTPEAQTDSTPQAKILLVDDEPKSLFALQELLSTLGQNLMIAQSGEEALRLALRNDFAVILLDVRMPGIDGFETARMIRNRERSRLTPIIFLTAAADEMSSMFRGYEAGAVDYLQKPVVPEILKAKVAVFVELFRKSERLRESEEKLRRLAAHLISVREEERAHIAREIHDELGQVLTGLKTEVTWLAKRLREKPLIEKTDSMCKLIDTTVQTVRKIATGLRPGMLDDMGIIAAVGWQVKEFQKRTSIRCRAKLPPEVKLDIDVSTTMFRIFQEILTNVARHSRATRVDMELTIAEDKVALEVVDNGVGIADSDLNGKKSLGLLGMHERALLFGGEVKITGTPGHGTRVSVNIPIRQRS